jgi:hypothetical protein
VFLPRLELDGGLEAHVRGAKIDAEFEEFRQWAGQHIEMIDRNQRSRYPYHREWSRQRIEDIERVLETDQMLSVDTDRRVEITQIQMEPGGMHTLFLMLDRPPDGRFGDTHTIQVEQWDARRRKPIGSLTTRVELVPEPDVKTLTLQLSTRPYRDRFLMLRARLFGADGALATPDTGASVRMTLNGSSRVYTDPLRYHGGWRMYWHLVDLGSARSLQALSATAFVNGVVAGRAEMAIGPVN